MTIDTIEKIVQRFARANTSVGPGKIVAHSYYQDEDHEEPYPVFSIKLDRPYLGVYHFAYRRPDAEDLELLS